MAANHEARYKLGMELTWLNDEAVKEITESLRDVIEIRDKTEEGIAEVLMPENQQCVNKTRWIWEEDLRSIGSAIQSCADAHVDPIFGKTEDFHLFIQDNNKLTYDVQNMVLKTLVDVSHIISFKTEFMNETKLSGEPFDRSI